MLKNIFSIIVLLACAQLCAMAPVVSGSEAKATAVRTCGTKGLAPELSKREGIIQNILGALREGANLMRESWTYEGWLKARESYKASVGKKE